MQRFTYLRSGDECVVDLPPCDAEVISGVQWGGPCELFTPAYWYTQYLMRAPNAKEVHRHRIGDTFAEELTACVLGGHGIPAEIGIAAFQRLKELGIISKLCADRAVIERHLRDPLIVQERTVTYRFWSQKATYLAEAFSRLRTENFLTTDGRALRDRLLVLPGIGPKTASWIVRNWLDSNEVAILDIHVYRAGVLAKVFVRSDDVRKHYVRMEERFIAFATGLGIPTSDLDALIWAMMRSTPRLVMRQFGQSERHRRKRTPPQVMQFPSLMS